MKPTLDHLFEVIAGMQLEDVKHLTKQFHLGSVPVEGMIEHLKLEVAELEEATSDWERFAEACDVLGVVLHLLHRMGVTPNTIVKQTLTKFTVRFEPVTYNAVRMAADELRKRRLKEESSS